MPHLRHTFEPPAASKRMASLCMMTRYHSKALMILLSLALASMVSRARPQQTSSAAARAHDSHQGLDVTADPYTDEERSKAKFGKKHPQEAGVLAVEVAFRNDNDKPISLNLDRIRLTIEEPGQRPQNIEPLHPDDAADLIIHPSVPPKQPRFPIPETHPKGGRSKDWQKLRDALQAASLGSDVLPPHGTIRGFLFFDLNHHFELLEHSSLYIPDLSFIPSKEALLYFEIELRSAVRP